MNYKKIEKAILTGHKAILNHKSILGWNDFKTNTSGKGTDWINSFVQSHLNNLINPSSDKFLDYLEKRCCIVGYNSNIPADTDSSAWAFLALAKNGRSLSNDAIYKWTNFMNSHWIENNCFGYSTYSTKSEIIEYKQKNGGWNNFEGWTRTPCLEITAVIFRAALVNGLEIKFQNKILKWLNYINSTDQINSYWWTKNWYLYKELFELLYTIKLYGNIKSELLDTTFKSVLYSMNLYFKKRPPISAFEKALCLHSYVFSNNICSSIRNEFIIMELLNSLIHMQNDNGLWISENIMRIPYPSDPTPWKSHYFDNSVKGTGGILGDQGIFSTVIVISALEYSYNLKEII